MSDKSKKNIDPKPIKDLAKILEELNLTEVSYSDGDFSVTVAKGTHLQPVDKDISTVSYTHLTLPTTSRV